MLFLPIATLSLPVAAKKTGEVEHLYQENCVSCHGSEVYTRSDRKVDSLTGLRNQVQRCEQNLGLTWFEEEITGVTDYLNQNYYQFTP